MLMVELSVIVLLVCAAVVLIAAHILRPRCPYCESKRTFLLHDYFGLHFRQCNACGRRYEADHRKGSQ